MRGIIAHSCCHTRPSFTFLLRRRPRCFCFESKKKSERPALGSQLCFDLKFDRESTALLVSKTQLVKHVNFPLKAIITSFQRSVTELRRWPRKSDQRRGRSFFASKRYSQVLEPRLLLSIDQITIETQDLNESGSRPVFNWTSDSSSQDTEVELWVDQFISETQRNSRVLYVPLTSVQTLLSQDLQGYQFRSPHLLPHGNYVAWLREKSSDGYSPWARTNFQLDNDSDSGTELPSVNRPAPAEFSVIREGQGFSGHSLSESRIAWTSDELLHDIWLNQQQADGHWSVHRRIRNVPGRSISFATLNSAPTRAEYSFFGQTSEQSGSRLESGTYRIFVRSINAAMNANGQWTGRGSWSAGINFSYTKIEAEAARPATLTATQELNTTIQWAAVSDAEHYLVNLWKGPNYSANQAITFRSHQTRIQFTAGEFRDGDRLITVDPGDQLFVRVRAVGQDGISELFTSINHRSITIHIPNAATVEPERPVIASDSSNRGSRQPLLSWEAVPNAKSYEVWMSSVDERKRIFLADGVRPHSLQLAPATLENMAEQQAVLKNQIDSDGLKPGRYRYWVRAHSPTFVRPSEWSLANDFEVVPDAVTQIDIDVDLPISQQPLNAPNLVLPFEDRGRNYLLISNGKGESFGASVLARYELDAAGQLYRPVIVDSSGHSLLEFSDLPMGSNVSALKRLSDGRLVVLSRGSSELRIVDPVDWQIDVTFELVADRSSEYPDAIGMEILSNDQIAIVFNRSDQLRIFSAPLGANSIEEIQYSEAGSEAGFLLESGRGVQLSSVRRPNGTFRLFVATPGQAATTIYEYDAESLSLSAVRTESGEEVKISRGRLANPFHGGTIASIQRLEDDGTEDFYFSADRSGFITWVHADSLSYGFIDLADWMTSVDRDPNSADYANPNDNSFDTTRFLPLDGSRLAVFGSRQQSVLLQLQVDSDGIVQVVRSAEMPRAYSGTLINRNGDEFIVSTGAAPFSRNQQISQVAVTQLRTADGAGQPAMSPLPPIVSKLANPLVAAHRFERGLVVQRSDGSIGQVVPNGDGNQLVFIPSGDVVTDSSGGRFLLTPDLFTSFKPHESDNSLLFVSAVSETSPSDPVLLVLKFDAETGIKITRIFSLDGMDALRSISVSTDQITILDRVGGKLLVIHDWTLESSSAEPIYDFHHQQPAELGAIRPAWSALFEDGTLAIAHDTVPDRGITVFAGSYTPSAEATIPVFHTNTTGTFFFDLHAFDSDRVISTTYGGDLVIKNVRAGIWEFDLPLNDLVGAPDIFAVESSSFRNDTLTINSPAGQAVVAFRVRREGGLIEVTVAGQHHVDDAIATLVDDDGYWIVRTGSIQKIRTAPL